jgi:hypothetical protein
MKAPIPRDLNEPEGCRLSSLRRTRLSRDEDVSQESDIVEGSVRGLPFQ